MSWEYSPGRAGCLAFIPIPTFPPRPRQRSLMEIPCSLPPESISAEPGDPEKLVVGPRRPKSMEWWWAEYSEPEEEEVSGCTIPVEAEARD